MPRPAPNWMDPLLGWLCLASLLGPIFLSQTLPPIGHSDTYRGTQAGFHLAFLPFLTNKNGLCLSRPISILADTDYL